MEKIDLRELNKMTKTFRACHRALKKITEGDDIDVVFFNSYGRGYVSMPVLDEAGLRRFFTQSLESEMTKLRKRFSDMGIDSMDVDKRKSKKAKLAAVGA